MPTRRINSTYSRANNVSCFNFHSKNAFEYIVFLLLSISFIGSNTKIIITRHKEEERIHYEEWPIPERKTYTLWKVQSFIFYPHLVSIHERAQDKNLFACFQNEKRKKQKCVSSQNILPYLPLVPKRIPEWERKSFYGSFYHYAEFFLGPPGSETKRKSCWLVCSPIWAHQSVTPRNLRAREGKKCVSLDRAGERKFFLIFEMSRA